MGWLLLLSMIRVGLPGESLLPPFQTGTVLVWKSEMRGTESNFVLRLAQFKPARYFEWENQTTQGTVLLKEKALREARKFVSFRLFQAGAEMVTNDEICYWLSEGLFRELKERKQTTWLLESIKTSLDWVGEENLEVTVDRAKVQVATVKARDGRGGFWWFLDDPENPLMVRRELNDYRESLKSVTSGDANSLRWIKGRKLKVPSAS